VLARQFAREATFANTWRTNQRQQHLAIDECVQFCKLQLPADQGRWSHGLGCSGVLLQPVFDRRQTIAAAGLSTNPAMPTAEQLAQFADMDVDVIVDDESPRPDDAHYFVLCDETSSRVDQQLENVKRARAERLSLTAEEYLAAFKADGYPVERVHVRLTSD
jgi:hypothetical protein